MAYLIHLPPSKSITALCYHAVLSHLYWSSRWWFSLSSPFFSFRLFYRNPIHFNINLSPILFSALLHCINILGSFGIRPRGIHSSPAINIIFMFIFRTRTAPSSRPAPPHWCWLLLSSSGKLCLSVCTLQLYSHVLRSLFACFIWMTLIYLVHDASHFSNKCLQISNINGSKVSTARAAWAFKQLKLSLEWLQEFLIGWLPFEF